MKMAEGYKRLCETFVQVHDAVLSSFDIDEICVVEGIISGEGDDPCQARAATQGEHCPGIGEQSWDGRRGGELFHGILARVPAELRRVRTP